LRYCYSIDRKIVTFQL